MFLTLAFSGTSYPPPPGGGVPSRLNLPTPFGEGGGDCAFLKDSCEHSYDVIPPTGERFSALSGLGIFTPFRCAHYWQQTLCDYNQVLAIPGLALLITKVLAGHYDLYIMILHNHMFFGAQ